MPHDHDDFLNVADAAAWLGVHIQTMRRLARQKKLPAFKLGRDWRFRRQALVQWADAQHRVDTPGRDACSVLVIDDDDGVARGLSRLLGGFGCQARLASGGIDGLAQVAQAVPDLILLDLVMPEMNGPEFLAELRRVHPELPVAIVTGYPDSELMIEATRYAPVMLLAKPIEPELLERTVRTALGDKLAMRSKG